MLTRFKFGSESLKFSDFRRPRKWQCQKSHWLLPLGAPPQVAYYPAYPAGNSAAGNSAAGRQGKAPLGFPSTPYGVPNSEIWFSSKAPTRSHPLEATHSKLPTRSRYPPRNPPRDHSESHPREPPTRATHKSDLREPPTKTRTATPGAPGSLRRPEGARSASPAPELTLMDGGRGLRAPPRLTR